jgi:hypothetical protein
MNGRCVWGKDVWRSFLFPRQLFMCRESAVWTHVFHPLIFIKRQEHYFWSTDMSESNRCEYAQQSMEAFAAAGSWADPNGVAVHFAVLPANNCLFRYKNLFEQVQNRPAIVWTLIHLWAFGGDEQRVSRICELWNKPTLQPPTFLLHQLILDGNRSWVLPCQWKCPSVVSLTTCRCELDNSQNHKRTFQKLHLGS